MAVTPNRICLCHYVVDKNPSAYIQTTPNPADPVVVYNNTAILIGRPPVCGKCKLPQTKIGSPKNPISLDYPGDGTCSYCGANNWDIDCGITLCRLCGNYD